MVIMVTAAALIYTFRHALISPLLSAWIVRQVEAATGLTVTVEKVGGTYLNQITVVNLVTRDAPAESPLRRIDLKRFEATYRPITLLKGTAAFIESVTVTLEQVQAALDWRLSAAAPRTAENEPVVLPATLPVPDWLPRIHLENASVDIRVQGFSTRLEGINADLVATRPGNRHLMLTAANWQWKVLNVSQGSAPVDLNLYVTNDSIAVAPFILGKNALSVTAGIRLDELPDALPFSVTLTTSGNPVAISGRLLSQSLEVAARTEKLDLGPISRGVLSEAFQVDGRLSLDGDMRIPYQRPSRFDGRLKLDLHQAAYGGFKAERLETAAAAESGSIRIHRLDLIDVDNTIVIRDLFLPEQWVYGTHDRRLLQGVSGRFKLDLQNVPSLLKVVGASIEQFPADVPTHRLQTDGVVESGGIVRLQGDFSASENTLLMEPSWFEIPLPGRKPDQSGLHVRLQTDFKDLGALSRLWPLPAIEGRLSGDISIEGTLDRPRGRVELRGQRLVVESVPVGSLSARLSSDNRQITVETAEISNGADAVNVKGTYDIRQQALSNARFAWKLSEIDAYLDSWAKLPISIQGDLQGVITANGPIKAPAAEITASSRRLQIGDTALTDIRLAANHRKGLLTIETAQGKVFTTHLTLSGTLDTDDRFQRFDANISALSVKRDGVIMQLPRPARIRYAPGSSLRFVNVALVGTAGDIRLDGEWSPAGASDIHLKVSGLSGNGWFSDLVGRDIDFEGLDAVARLQGTVSAPRIELAGQLNALRNPYAPFPLAGRFDLAYEQNRLAIHAFDWSGEGGYRIRAAGSVSFPCKGDLFSSDGPLSLSGSVQLPEAAVFNMLTEAQPIVDGSLAADLTVEGSWRSPFVDLRLMVQGLKLKPELAAMLPGGFDIQSRIQYRSDSVFIDTLDIRAPGMEISGNGVWRNGLSAAMLCNPPAGQLPGEIAVDGTIRVSDMSMLASRTPQIRRSEGSLDADFKLRGTVIRPEVSATVSVNNGLLRTQMNLPPWKRSSCRRRSRHTSSKSGSSKVCWEDRHSD